MTGRLLDRVRSRRVTLWTLIVPPSCWAAHFLFSYLWAAVRCAKFGSFATEPAVFWGGTVLAVLAILASGGTALVQTRAPGDQPPHNDGTRVDRLRFVAYATLLLAGLSLMAVVFTAVPVLFIADCR